MNTQHESGSLNGSATLYLMVGEIRSDVKHLRSDVQDVSGRVQRLERTARRKPEPHAWIQLSGLSAKELLILGLAVGMGVTGTVTPEVFRAFLFGP
jgi:hypothetical protein